MKQIKRILCAALSLTLLAGLCVTPASAVGDDWKTAYRTAISKNLSSFGNTIQLVDLDLDGTPELIIGGMPGSGLFSEFLYGFTMENGQLKALSGKNNMDLGDSYTLYRNNSTGAYRIEGPFTLRAGMGYYSTLTASYFIRNGEVVCYVGFGTGKQGDKSTYYGAGGYLTSASSYKTTRNNWYNGWTKVRDVGVQTIVSKKTSSSELTKFLNSYPSSPVYAKASTHKIQLNGTPVSIGAYEIGGNNYFKLRDVAMLLKDTQGKFQVGFDEATQRITLTTGYAYTAVGGELAARDSVSRLGNPSTSSIYVDNQAVDLTAYNISDNNYFKLRDLGEALGFAVTWDDATQTVNIVTAK